METKEKRGREVQASAEVKFHLQELQNGIFHRGFGVK
jgi:hypothetical protein